MNIAIYPGSFDPITNGHVDIINRASLLFDKVIISVSKISDEKTYTFNIDERMTFIIRSIKHLNNVEVKIFDELLIKYVKKLNANIILRGLRALSDFELEFKMALMNRKLDDDIDTLFLMPDQKYTHISSSLIKEVALLGGCISEYVPEVVESALKKKYEK